MRPASVLMEFRDAEQLLAAVRRTRRAGYSRLDAFTPFPVEGLSEALALPPTRLRSAMFAAAASAATLTYALQHWSAVRGYPVNAGGRPLASWPAFLLVTFEVAILAAALAGFTSLVIGGDLTRLDHPLLAIPGFAGASTDRFFLAIDAGDPVFHRARTHAFAESLGAISVHEVPA